MFNIKIKLYNWCMVIRVPLSKETLRNYIKEIEPLKSGFDAVSDHVVITDPNSNILYANEAVSRNTGFSHDEIIGKTPGDLWGGDTPKEFYQKMWRTIKEKKQPFVGEVENIKKDGTRYWQEIHISPILDSAGDVRFFIGIEPNITDRKEKEKFREEFISILGHQLRSPLSAANWSLEFLLKSGKISEDQKKTLDDLYKGNQGLLHLVTDLLTLSRIGGGRMVKEMFDVHEVINEIMGQARKAYPHVLFSFVAEGGSFLIRAEKQLALQVLSNIISNAAEYSREKGGVVELSLRKEKDTYAFSCKDNGIGIPKEDQPHIFSRFFRAANAKVLNPKGTGLGLFIVKLIADNFGWNVRFESPLTKDGGTVFFVSIPV